MKQTWTGTNGGWRRRSSREQGQGRAHSGPSRRTLATVILAAGLLTGLEPGEGRAMFVRSETEQVPVSRLVTNLEQRVASAPKDFHAHYALARVHSMAYALKEGELPVEKGSNRPFYGHGPQADCPPRQVREVGGAPGGEASRAHLQKAIEQYRKAVSLNSQHVPSRLGLAWCLDQAGRREAAVQAYREALALAWAKEKREDHVFVSTMTEEIARYLLPLLDPKEDAEEIAKVKQIQEAIDKKPRAVTPLLLPLQPGLELAGLVDPHARVQFDLDGTNLGRSWGWITPQAGWLVYDLPGSGRIQSGLQLIGGVSFWIFWENGYQALAALDDDQDGVLQGRELDGLGLWHDANSNGRSEPGEVQPLAALGITALSCSHEWHHTGIPFNPRGARFRDGTWRPTYDWIVQTAD